MEIPARQRAAAKALAKARFWTVSSEDVDVGTKGDGQWVKREKKQKRKKDEEVTKATRNERALSKIALGKQSEVNSTWLD